MQRYRLLAIDIDGTLVNTEDEISQRTRNALAELQSVGTRIVLTTGRRYRRALPVAQALGLDSPVVTASGSLVKRPHDHHTVFVAHIEQTVVRQIVDVVERAGFEVMLYADTFHEGFDFYCRGVDDPRPTATDFFSRNRSCARIVPDLMNNLPVGVFGGFAMGTKEEMTWLMTRLNAELPAKLYLHVLRSPRYVGYMCEIARADVTKWTSLRRLAREWGIADKEICAVGDDVNDIPMVQGAGLGVAMGNAQDALKDVADRVAPSLDDNGLAVVAGWLMNGGV